MAQHCHDMQYHDLRIEMARQCRSLMNHTSEATVKSTGKGIFFSGWQIQGD
jgi:hypothetical protein